MNSETPEFFKYDASGELDVEATLAAVPEKLGDMPFFSQVPDWFEVGEPAEMQEILDKLDHASEEEKADMPPEILAQVREQVRDMLRYSEIYHTREMTPERRKVLRAVIYWISLQTMTVCGEYVPEDFF